MEVLALSKMIKHQKRQVIQEAKSKGKQQALQQKQEGKGVMGDLE